MAEPAAPAVTARAVGLGLVLTIALNLVMNYSDFYLNNTLLMGNHFPIAGMAVLLGMVVVANPALARRSGAGPFTPGELLLVWSMIGVAGGIGSSGLMRYLPGWVAGPAYYASNTNGYGAHLLAFLPSWMVVSRDPEDPALRWFFEGLPRGHRIPWGEWLRPLGCWFVFALLLSGVMFAFCSLFYRHWVDRERLIFPVVSLPLAMAAAPPRGRLLNDFLRDPVVWAGAAVPILIHGWNGLGGWLPGLPAVPLAWDTWGWFPDRPWDAFNLEDAIIYFSVVGLTFLLTIEVSFSFWFCFVAYRFTFVYIAWLGAGDTGFLGGDWKRNVTVFQAAGGVLAITGFLAWSARKTLRAWWGRARRGLDDPWLDPVPARWALVLLAGGVAGMAGWMIAAGCAWWAALAAVLLFPCVLLVLTRLVAEAGLLFVISDVAAYDVVSGIAPPAALSGGTLASLTMQKGVMMHTLREIQLPYLMNGVRAGDAAGVPPRRLLAVLALTAAVAMGVSAYGRITTCYKYGAAGGDDFANLQMQESYFGNLVRFRKSPPPMEWITAGTLKLVPVSVAHVVIGALVAGATLALRAAYLGFPLTPYGFLLCGTWGMAAVWFSIFLGWLAKACVMTFGGAAAYRRALPFFLGLVLGESAIATVWILVSFATGHPGIRVLPQ